MNKWTWIASAAVLMILLLSAYVVRLVRQRQSAKAAARVKAQLRKQYPQRHPTDTIFVYIVSFREPAVADTVCDLFEKALYPMRVHVGLCSYVSVDVEDRNLKQTCLEKINRHSKIRENVSDNIMSLSLPIEHERGPVYAMHLIQTRLFGGQRFSLVLDGSARMCPAWDELLVRQWDSSSSHSSSSPRSSGVDPFNTKTTCITAPLRAEGAEHAWAWHHGKPSEALAPQYLRPTGRWDSVTGTPELESVSFARAPHGTTAFTPFWSAQFSFAPSIMHSLVPFDASWIDCWSGDSVLLTAKLVNAGWTLRAPTFEMACSPAQLIRNSGSAPLPNLVVRQTLTDAEMDALRRVTGVDVVHQTMTNDAFAGLSPLHTDEEVSCKHGSNASVQARIKKHHE